MKRKQLGQAATAVLASLATVMAVFMLSTSYSTTARGHFQSAINTAVDKLDDEKLKPPIRRCAFVEGVAFEYFSNGFSLLSVLSGTSAADRALQYVKSCAQRATLRELQKLDEEELHLKQ